MGFAMRQNQTKSGNRFHQDASAIQERDPLEVLPGGGIEHVGGAGCSRAGKTTKLLFLVCRAEQVNISGHEPNQKNDSVTWRSPSFSRVWAT